MRHGKGYGEITVEVERDSVSDGPAGETTLRTLMGLPVLGARYAVTGDNPALLPTSINSQATNALMAWPDGERTPGQEHLMAALRNARRGWFVCGYGPYRRLYGNARTSEKLEPRENSLATLFTEERALTDVEDWLIELHNLAREERDKEEQRLKKLGQSTEAIPPGQRERRHNQVLELFRKGFLPDPEPVDLKIDAGSVKLKIGKGEPVPFLGLSDGYRSMLALGGDLLRRLGEAYPDAEELTDCPGIVLIDELDAHAHPAWQREIGHWLRKKFPRLQFIITTHSPFLAQVADEPGGNIVLELGEEGVKADPQEETAEDWRVDQVLTLFFGLDSPRSSLFEQRREKLGRLLMRPEQQLSTDERRELEQLRIWAQQLPPANETRERILRAKEIQQESEELADQIRELE
ncbi:MAG: AAA family ATPase [Oscillochloris sp.]|nr:AAA family ATPase [Oscillochloris sp.]